MNQALKLDRKKQINLKFKQEFYDSWLSNVSQ